MIFIFIFFSFFPQTLVVQIGEERRGVRGRNPRGVPSFLSIFFIPDPATLHAQSIYIDTHTKCFIGRVGGCGGGQGVHQYTPCPKERPDFPPFFFFFSRLFSLKAS